MFRAQVSGHTPPTALLAAVRVAGRADQDLALDVNRLFGSQELKGLETETCNVCGATDSGFVGAVHLAPGRENDGQSYQNSSPRLPRNESHNIFIC